MESAAGSLEAVVAAFSAQVAELREATLLRADDTARQLYRTDLEAVEATVCALESKLRDVRAYVKADREALPQLEAAIQAARLQRRHLEHIAAHLPTYLPSLPETAPGAAGGVLLERSNQQASAPAAQQPKKRPPPAAAPRRYVSQGEFESLSSYMRGRLTCERVNAALGELAAHSERNAALVAAARRNRPLGSDKKHALWLLYCVANQESLRGRFWALEADLKAGSSLRLDKSGKAMLTLLRHLGRLTEVRLPVEGTTHLVYVINE